MSKWTPPVSTPVPPPSPVTRTNGRCFRCKRTRAPYYLDTNYCTYCVLNHDHTCSHCSEPVPLGFYYDCPDSTYTCFACTMRIHQDPKQKGVYVNHTLWTPPAGTIYPNLPTRLISYDQYMQGDTYQLFPTNITS